MREYITVLLSNYLLIPAAAMCLFPMRNQLRYSWRGTLNHLALLFVIALPVEAWLTWRFTLGSNALTLPLVTLFFLCYHRSLRVHLSKSLAVFTCVCAWMSIISNLASAFEALYHPHSGANDFSLEGDLFLFGLSTLLALLLYYPLSRYGSRLVDQLNYNRVWYTTIPVSGIFLILNVLVRPLKYETLYVNRVFLFFWLALPMFLLLTFLLCVIFYFIVMSILNAAQMEERNRVLEAQESQYLTQQKYMEETSRARHDFKQTIRTLNGLFRAGDYDTLGTYLERYAHTVPENDIQHYCANHALNALLNYYANTALQSGIQLRWEFDLPEQLSVSDVDLCSMVGNILENAVTACQELERERRWIQLSVLVEYGTQLYIVATNSFSGRVRQRDGEYLSIHRKGNGVGLRSIRSTAEKYSGSAVFHHEGTVFCTDVMIPLK